MCEKFKVIDLFAGCGGFSKGFQMTNHFDIKLAIEIDENASKIPNKMLSYNFSYISLYLILWNL